MHPGLDARLQPAVLELEGVSKAFGGVEALRKVDFTLRSGEIHGLVGETDARALMGSLPIGMQQLVELSRVLFSGARIIILDEPTSALSAPEVERLFGLLRRLKDAGKSIIFISHFLDDVLKIADRVTVLRNSEKIATANAGDTDKRWIIE